MLSKSVLEEWHVRVSSKKCLPRVSSKSVLEECQIRVSCKSVLPERSAIVSSKGVLQECQLSVSSQGVPQDCSLEIVTNKYSTSVSQHTCRHSGSWASSCFLRGALAVATPSRGLLHVSAAGSLRLLHQLSVSINKVALSRNDWNNMQNKKNMWFQLSDIQEKTWQMIWTERGNMVNKTGHVWTWCKCQSPW